MLQSASSSIESSLSQADEPLEPSLHVVNQDRYSYAVSNPGSHELTQEEVGSRYAYSIVRTFIDADEPEDVKAANALQDAILVGDGGRGPLDIPDWNVEQLRVARAAMNTLATLGTDTARSFGTKEETDYSFNGVTAKPNEDGSFSIHFGSCDDGRVNFLPISKGWNYAARMYEPRPEILDGAWTFPVSKPKR